MQKANRMQRLGTETAFEVLAKVNQLKAEEKDVVSFCIGEPDFDTPQHIKEAAVRALEQGYTHYSLSAEILPLREAVAHYTSTTRGTQVDAEEVVITPGAKPKGAFYAYPNVTEVCQNLGLPDSNKLQEYLLHEAHVAVLSRTCFGCKNEGEKDEYIRLSYATSNKDIQEGLERIKKVVEK